MDAGKKNSSLVITVVDDALLVHSFFVPYRQGHHWGGVSGLCNHSCIQTRYSCFFLIGSELTSRFRFPLKHHCIHTPPPSSKRLQKNLSMGIHDAKHNLENWLFALVSGAFFYALPDGFAPSLIVHDLTALMVAAFHSPKVHMGADFINYLMRPIDQFGRADDADGGSINYTQYCSSYEETNSPASYPSKDDLRQWTSDDFHPNINKTRAVYVLSRDDSRYMPENRSMVHDHRYTEAKDAPFTDDEVRAACYHVCKHRPMPGIISEYAEEVPPNLSEVRRRAAHTPIIRDAYQQYGPWALLREVAQERHLNNPADDTRFVLIDNVLADFPGERYEHAELMSLPKDWARGAKHSELVRLRSGKPVGRVQSPKVGETDLKFIWYIENMSKPGDHILLRCDDSDMLYILLLHMDRWLDSGRVIFLDCMPRSEERLHKRFVCLNVLAQGLKDVAATRWPGLDSPLAAIAFLALCCGSDYTRSHYYITSKAIIEAFDANTNDNLKMDYGEGWRLLRQAMVRFSLKDGKQNLSIIKEWLKDIDGSSGITWPALFDFDTEALVDFFSLLYQRRMGENYMYKEYSLPRTRLLKWKEVEFYTQKRYAKTKDPTNYTPPTIHEITAEVRRIMWTMLYWSNAHLGMGSFPMPLSKLTVDDTDVPLWGWLKAPENATTSKGNTRAISESANARIYERNAFHNPSDTFDAVLSSLDKKTGVSDKSHWVVVHARRVAPPDRVLDVLVAEWLHACINHTAV